MPNVGGVVALIVIELKMLQPEKAELPILVTPPSIVSEVNLLHKKNADDPIFVTLAGIVI